MYFFLLFLTSLIFYLFLSWKRKAVHGLPPGPHGLPLVGNALQIGTEPHFVFAKWAQTFGKLFTIHLGRNPVLVVSDAKIMKQLLSTSAATGKFSTEPLKMIFSGNYGLLVTEGTVWQEQIQFCFRTLRELGFGRTAAMESNVIQEVDGLCSWLENQQLQHGKVMLKEKLHQVWGSFLWKMTTGDETSDGQIKTSMLLNEWLNHLQFITNSGLLIFPWIKYLAPDQSGYTKMKNLSKKIRSIVKNYFDEHKRTKKNGKAPRDMIDAYIDKVESCQDPQSSFYGERGWKHAHGCILQLMLAGADGMLLNWTIFYLSAHPKVQRTLQAEIDREIGKCAAPSFTDMAKLPYVEAVYLETLRCASLTATGGTVKLLENVSSNGYHLPKGLLIIPNFYHLHNDKSVWGDPENFRPERFLEGGESLKENVSSFQVGRRACPGKYFTKNFLYLFTTKIFQKYTISTDPTVENVKEYLTPLEGFIFMPKQLAVVVTPRA